MNQVLVGVRTTLAAGAALLAAGCCAPPPQPNLDASWNVNCPMGCSQVNFPWTFTGPMNGPGSGYGHCRLTTVGANRVLNMKMLSQDSRFPDHGIWIVDASFPAVGAPASAWELRVYLNTNEWTDTPAAGRCSITLSDVQGDTVSGLYSCSNLVGGAGLQTLNVCANGDRGCATSSSGSFSVQGCSVQ